MLSHRDILSEFFLCLLQISLYNGLIFTVYENPCSGYAEQILQGIALVHEHIAGGRTHENLNARKGIGLTL